MKYFILSGSHRPGSQSRKVARFIASDIQSQYPDAASFVLDIATANLPFWDEGMWEDSEKWAKAWGPVAAQLRDSDAFIVVAPEWGGMVPAGVKNFFLLASSAELGHKPGLIVGVSETRGGAYPVSELRSSSYKNNYLCYIPEHLIVRNVTEVLNTDGHGASSEDQYIRDRISYTIRVLHTYAEALKHVRKSGVIDTKTYPYGM